MNGLSLAVNYLPNTNTSSPSSSSMPPYTDTSNGRTKKAANKSERWFIQNTVRQRRRAWKGRGSYGPIHQGWHKKRGLRSGVKNGGEIESKRRGNIVTRTQRLCVSGQTLIWFPFFPRLAVAILPSNYTHTHTKSRRNKLANDWTHIPGFLLFNKNWHFTNREETMAIKGKKQSSRQQYLRQVSVITETNQSWV